MFVVPIVPLRRGFVTPRPVVSCLIPRISSLFFPFFPYLFFFFIFSFYVPPPTFLSTLYVFRFFSFHPFFFSFFFFFLFYFSSSSSSFFSRPSCLTTALKVQFRVRKKLQELTTPRSLKIDGVHPDGVVHSPFGSLERLTEVFDATPTPLWGILHDQ